MGNQPNVSRWTVRLPLQNNASMCRPAAYHRTVSGRCRPAGGKLTQLFNCVTASNLNSSVRSLWACNPRNGTSPVDHWPHGCLCWVSDSFTWVRATHSITKTLAQDQKETLHRLSSRRFRSRASNARNTVCICRLRSRRLCRESMDSWRGGGDVLGVQKKWQPRRQRRGRKR